jgi:hypothetical protein
VAVSDRWKVEAARFFTFARCGCWCLLTDVARLLLVDAASLWLRGYWLGINNGCLALASFLRHVASLFADNLLDLDVDELWDSSW